MQGECEEAAPQDLTNRMAGLSELLSGSALSDQSEKRLRFLETRASAQVSPVSSRVSLC